MTKIPEGYRPISLPSPYIDHIGPVFETGEGADYKLGLRVAPHHANRLGHCHGAVMAVLADVGLLRVLAMSVTPRLVLVTSQLAMDFLSPAKQGQWMEISGRVDRMGRSLCHSSGMITADGKAVLRCTGVFQIVRNAGIPGG